ncbi:hypothetical protein Glove_54g90 [Diversispora epigaea]|uniref:Uncharacterized protein n=1 Tax=Diversispora epigaea TaxID=1348612 RepID=A0A397JG23_9GLOM|nr:hypothetical protein Glove_54g90 [Diversispora epigaea]
MSNDIQVSYFKILCEKQLILGSSLRLILRQSSNNDISYSDLNRSSHLRSNSSNSISISPDGIKAHKKKEYKEAWEFFNEHADLGFNLAKYWKADKCIYDARLRYAFRLLEIIIDNSENNEIMYITIYDTSNRWRK